uniref:Uncharacterized protein n=1 Tax=Arundo donax TaxID=35708 RepID=A0A0A9BYW1_ARUDO
MQNLLLFLWRSCLGQSYSTEETRN